MSEASHFPSSAEQDRILDTARSNVKKSAYFMKRSLDQNDLREGLRHARDMLGELRISQLNPQKYYDLYMLVFDELAHLRLFITEEHKKGHKFADLYQLVQHAGNVLPRLYLMCTVGCEYIRLKAANPRIILKDLGELCKGVQHPIRGLFLRSYLCQVSRRLLPENDIEDEQGNIHDAVEFLLSNFIEMNKLWVRMQFQGSKFDQEKREKERMMLQDLVGKNLTFLSQLDGLDFNLYSSMILRRVIDQIISCEDVIAQQYLMQCVIQCFPDEYHLETLDEVLDTLPQLKSGVKLHTVIASLMDRLAAFAEQKPESVKNSNAYEKLEMTCLSIVISHTDMHAADVIDMYIAMLNFTSSIYPDRLDYINGLLASCLKAFSDHGVISNTKGETSLLELLSLPLSKYNAIALLDLDAYPRLMDLLRPKKRKEVTIKIAKAILDGGFKIVSVDNVEKFFLLITAIVKDPDVSAGDEDEEEGEWVDGQDNDVESEVLEEEQTLVAKLIHQISSEIMSEQFEMLKVVLQNLEAGGFKRMKYTLTSLFFSGLKLIRNLSELKSREAVKAEEEGDLSFEDIFNWLLSVCGLLVEAPLPMMALQSLLQCAIAASEEAKLEDITYDCFEMACTLFEESISNSSEKSSALQAIVSALHRCHVFSPESRASLSQAILGYCAQLLKKDEQCKAICLYSHIFWQDKVGEGEEVKSVREPSDVMKSLKRCVNLANAAQRRADILARMGKSMETVGLYIELLNNYLYYFDRGNESIKPSVIQQLIDLIENEIADKQVSEATGKYYNNTLEHILFQFVNEEASERYQGIEVPALRSYTQKL